MARTPLYKAAETEMIRRIESGEWEVGKRLPNEFVLAEEFKVSQGTMRRALDDAGGHGPSQSQTRARDAGGKARVNRRPPGRRWWNPDVGGASVAFEVHRAKSGLRGANDAEATLFGTGRLSHVERLLKRGGARAGVEDIAIPESIAPRSMRMRRCPSPTSWRRMGCKQPASPKRSAPISRRCRSPCRCRATGTRRFWWSRAPPKRQAGQTIARQVMRLIADAASATARSRRCRRISCRGSRRAPGCRLPCPCRFP
jgi:hypothetical protein